MAVQTDTRPFDPADRSGCKHVHLVRSRGLLEWRTTLASWRRNRTARSRMLRCALLDPRFASDIGLTLDEVETECRAPFWRAVARLQGARPTTGNPREMTS
jgi:uncharacterized protein YjiS (DUF1127 family)